MLGRLSFPQRAFAVSGERPFFFFVHGKNHPLPPSFRETYFTGLCKSLASTVVVSMVETEVKWVSSVSPGVENEGVEDVRLALKKPQNIFESRGGFLAF